MPFFPLKSGRFPHSRCVKWDSEESGGRGRCLEIHPLLIALQLLAAWASRLGNRIMWRTGILGRSFLFQRMTLISLSVCRACRLKKKAQHEANKIKLWGLNQEYGQYMHEPRSYCEGLCSPFIGWSKLQIPEKLQRVWSLWFMVWKSGRKCFMAVWNPHCGTWAEATPPSNSRWNDITSHLFMKCHLIWFSYSSG